MKVLADFLETGDQLEPESASNESTYHRRGFSVKSTRRSVKRQFRKLSATLSAPQPKPNDEPINNEPLQRNGSFRQSKKKKHPAEQWPPKLDSMFFDNYEVDEEGVCNF
jgi:hypothetical protein